MRACRDVAARQRVSINPIARTRSSLALGGGRAGFRHMGGLFGEICVDFGHELLQGPADVISSHVVVQIFPNAFDAIVVGAIGRQKVELNSIAQGRQGKLSLATAVNFVVVKNEMNPSCMGIVSTCQLPELLNEELAILTIGFHPSQLSGAGIQRAR